MSDTAYGRPYRGQGFTGAAIVCRECCMLLTSEWCCCCGRTEFQLGGGVEWPKATLEVDKLDPKGCACVVGPIRCHREVDGQWDCTACVLASAALQVCWCRPDIEWTRLGQYIPVASAVQCARQVRCAGAVDGHPLPRKHCLRLSACLQPFFGDN